MIQHLLVLLGNSFISFNVGVFLSKKIGQSRKTVRLGVLFIFFAVLAGGLFQFYQENKAENYYDIMNINKNFTSKELRKSYRNFMMQYHPDKAKDESQKKEYEEKYIQIQNINSILQNQEYKQLYDTFGSIEVPKSKGSSKKAKEEQQVFESQVEGKYFLISLDLYFFYAIATMVVIVLTEEGQVKYSRAQCFLTLGLFFAYDYLLVKGPQHGEYLEKIDFLEYLFPRSIFPERSFLLRLMFGVFINFFRGSAFANDDKSHEKLFNDCKFLAQKYLGLAKKIEDNSDLVQNPEKLKELINQHTDKPFDKLMETLEKNVNAEEKSKQGFFYRFKKVIKNLLSWALFGMSMYYMYNLLTSGEDSGDVDDSAY